VPLDPAELRGRMIERAAHQRDLNRRSESSSLR
jgi:hypothetical protein